MTRLLAILALAGCGFSKSADEPADLSSSGAMVLPDLTTPPLRVFVTSMQFPGNIDNNTPGVLAADLKCILAGGGGKWRAWLSDSNGDAIDRVLGSGPWARSDGQIAFPRRPDEAPLVKLNLDERGKPVEANAHVWSGTGANGRDISGADCIGWSTIGSLNQGEFGIADVVPAGWTQAANQPCNASAHLYCFEQN